MRSAIKRISLLLESSIGAKNNIVFRYKIIIAHIFLPVFIGKLPLIAHNASAVVVCNVYARAENLGKMHRRDRFLLFEKCFVASSNSKRASAPEAQDRKTTRD